MNICICYLPIFLVALGLTPVEIGVILFTGIGFIVIFAYSSATGDYQGLVKTTLENDAAKRKKNLLKK